MAGTCQGTLWEVRDGSGDLWEGPVGVGGPSGRSETGQGTLPEVRDGSGYIPRGPGRV